MRLVADPLLCNGCRVCELICSFIKNGTFSPSRARIRIQSYYDGRDKIVSCVDCEKPKCIDSCPRGAISKAETGIFIDKAKCDGCGLCVEACVNGSLKIDPIENIAISCDFCGECINYCPPKVLVMK